ncbi:MAG: alpha/beta hydrolase fold domain-containing protein [bacterium]|nr:alpha/beta hydrolase [Gammaproteobacteria bacterium]HIL98233.1 alpha/beta hydrolase [Pseudomonadales bacterium]
MSTNNPNLPGRLGNPDANLQNDHRADPRIVQAIEAVGGFAPGIESPGPDGSYQACLDYCMAFEDGAALAHPLMMEAMPAFDNVSSTTEVIKGVDGNDITLFIDRPKDTTGNLPCIVHTHGGGMVLMTAADPGFIRWRKSLAETGLIVVGVEFRNGGGSLGNHPFPAGLNDCASATQWVFENKSKLGVSSIVISGESGGGNLSIATTLKAKQEGWSRYINGVYAMCPYICGNYGEPPAELLSLEENNGYMLNTNMMVPLVKVYDPEGANANNPLAWPYQASVADLEGLPPHIISVNELDPLRDEGLAFYRKLLAANVSAVARTVHGTPHAGDQGYPDVTPEIFQETIRSLSGFAKSL